MDKIWAPWRLGYIRGKKQKGCVFCKSIRKQEDGYVIFKTSQAIAMLNIFPYNNGHMLISPLRHLSRLDQLTEPEALGLFRAVKKAQGLLEKVLKPQGFNIGVNLSRSAGAGITGHLHIHIVPRWAGDTNFMPAVFGTKVISESLEQLCKQLRAA
ncbi:MAG: HIT domain-containing protein [Candidatus Omnitrophota bacterium]